MSKRYKYKYGELTGPEDLSGRYKFRIPAEDPRGAIVFSSIGSGLSELSAMGWRICGVMERPPEYYIFMLQREIDPD